VPSHLGEKGRQRKRLQVAAGFARQENAIDRRNQMLADRGERSHEDRHADDQPATRCQHSLKGRDRGIEARQVLEELLADDDIV